ncbi:MAG: hypothetical protein E5W04_28850 [Mesorhizobium sp.]|nr:MAG: hypothetical protein E5W04_28850 [Mesorhizobium sp.]
MLERILEKLLPASADAAEREWLASLLIAAFQNGATDEAALVATMERKQTVSRVGRRKELDARRSLPGYSGAPPS